MRWIAAMALAAMAASPASAAAPADDDSAVDVQVIDASWTVPAELTLRVRLRAIEPNEPTPISWRHGGEGLGGSVVRGAFSDKPLPVGAWSPPRKVTSLVRKGRFPAKLFLTVTAGNPGRDRRMPDGSRVREGFSTGAVFEFQLAWRGSVLKTFREAGPDGGTAGIVLPAGRLAGGKPPTDEHFLAGVTGLLAYARRRADRLEALPWAHGPLPRKLAIINNVGGYGRGSGYGIRHTNKAIVAAECRSLHQLGVNGFRGPDAFLVEAARRGDELTRPFTRAWIVRAMGYPVPTWRPPNHKDPDAGCPYADGVAERTQAGVAEALAALDLPVDEVWALTVDEIGAVIDRAPEGKGHLAVCPRCAAAFRAFLREHGVRPADVGAADWQGVRPACIWQPPAPRPGPPPKPAVPTNPFAPTPPAGPADKPEPDGPVLRPPDLDDPREALLAWWTLRFNNHMSARLFSPLRDAFTAANAARRQALAAGRGDATAARRARGYAYALRGNTFLMKGHSLDFFHFYRHADNAMVYETSNRDGRIWGWDSYLCDVGRFLSRDRGLGFGVYVKPHRGAPVQRALSAAARGATMLYWYTYGPDYKKGDSFSQHPDVLDAVSKTARILGRAEDALYGSEWAARPRVAVVKPRTSGLWLRLAPSPARRAAWENAKWVYTALQHAHLPVDAIDEDTLAAGDLTGYRTIYVNGPNLRRDAAAGLARWVRRGGTLCTFAGGLARDEANRPLDELAGVLGLAGRDEPEMALDVALYGATRLERWDDARRLDDANDPPAVEAPAEWGGAFTPVVGRERLRPAEGTEVLARFADGSPAITRRAVGEGEAVAIGVFAGLEYSAGVRHDRFDMTRDFPVGVRRLASRPAARRVKPAVDASSPCVEGVLLRHPRTGRRAVVLMNWAYRVTAHRLRGKRRSIVTGMVPAEDLTVAVRGAGAVKAVRSVWGERELAFDSERDVLTVRVGRLEEGDVLLLE